MDGHLFAVNSEKVAAGGELSTFIAGNFRIGVESESQNKGLYQELQGGTPIAGLLLQSTTAIAAILGTCGASWLGRLFLTPAQSVEQLAPDLVALLVFFLFGRHR